MSSEYPVITGVLSSWCIHRSPLPEEYRAEFQRYRPGCIPCVVTGIVEVDHKKRFAPGTALMSSLMLGVDLETMSVHTLNSTYQLTGAGEIRDEAIPTDYAEAVGRTIVRLAEKNGQSLMPDRMMLHS